MHPPRFAVILMERARATPLPAPPCQLLERRCPWLPHVTLIRTSTMITFITVPKPFTGHTGVIQRNAIGSWTASAPGSQVILCGREPGTAESADELGAEHVPEVRCSRLGAPFRHGFDFLAMHRRRIDRVLDFLSTTLAFGRPWWDHYLPLALIACGARPRHGGMSAPPPEHNA